MKAVTRILLERLRSGLLSRNRHFALFIRPDAREALRVHHFLRSLERDLVPRSGDVDAPPTVSIQPHAHEDAVTLHVELPHIRASRTCRLTRSELAVLLSHPALRQLIALSEG